MIDRLKIGAFEDYFRNEFSECFICRGCDGWTAETWVHVDLKDGTEMPEVRVTWEFLRDYDADKISEQLRVWRASECLQVASGGKCVLVTDAGIHLRDA